MSDPQRLFTSIDDAADAVLIGNDEIVEGLTTAVLTGGHVLLEGVPGVAKTTIANLFSRATGLSYRRIQMTPDILPADITGTHVYRENTGEFELQRGPVFANVVVADEINRATPKTQSALLEAMQERQVTIEGETLSLPEPFIVIATQNPIEYSGTFELPEAQRDRFQLKLTVDLPERAHELELLDRFDDRPDLSPAVVQEAVTPSEIAAARETVDQVYVDSKVKSYIVDVIEETRTQPAIEYGASPRASLALLNAGKARAAIHGRDYVIPDDINHLAPKVLTHRLVLGTETELGDRPMSDVIDDVLSGVVPPQSSASASDGRDREPSEPAGSN